MTTVRSVEATSGGGNSVLERVSRRSGAVIAVLSIAVVALVFIVEAGHLSGAWLIGGGVVAALATVTAAAFLP